MNRSDIPTSYDYGYWITDQNALICVPYASHTELALNGNYNDAFKAGWIRVHMKLKYNMLSLEFAPQLVNKDRILPIFSLLKKFPIETVCLDIWSPKSGTTNECRTLDIVAAKSFLHQLMV